LCCVVVPHRFDWFDYDETPKIINDKFLSADCHNSNKSNWASSITTAKCGKPESYLIKRMNLERGCRPPKKMIYEKTFVVEGSDIVCDWHK